jgi:site-specific DNA-methyltransferase (adenine-specific)
MKEFKIEFSIHGVGDVFVKAKDKKDAIANVCDVFDCVKRDLRDDGTLWVVIGDKYTRTKELSLIPARFAIEMAARGWILRNDIIWHKPNAMPSSVRDRFTGDHEYIFFFSKEKDYYFEQQLEPFVSPVNPVRDKGAEAYGRLALGDGKLIASAGVRNWYRCGLCKSSVKRTPGIISLPSSRRMANGFTSSGSRS